MKKKTIATLLTVSTLTMLFTTCTFDTFAETETSTSEDVLEVVVAGTPGYAPYTYVGDDGEETGFDIEILKEIGKIAPEMDVKCVYSEWDTLMPGLDAGKFDIICNQLGKNEERESMYHFQELPICLAGGMIITNETYKDGTGWESLEGATVECITGSSFTAVVEKYLEENPGAFEVVYTEGSLAQVLEDINNGIADATLEDPAVAKMSIEKAGLQDKLFIIDQIYDPFLAYYMFAKTERGEQIASIVDKYLPELYYNGTLSELAMKYIGLDSGITALPEEGFYTEATLEEYRAAQ